MASTFEREAPPTVRSVRSPLSSWVRRLERARWLVLCTWLLLLAIAALGALGLADRLSGGGWYKADSQSSRAVDATKQNFVGRGQTTLTLVIRDDRFTAGSADFDRRVGAAYDYVVGLDALHVESAYGWGTTSGPARDAFLGEGNRTTLTTLGLEVPDGDARRELPHVQDELDDRFAGEELTVALVGPAAAWGEINKLSEQGLIRAELLALPLLLAIMLWIYRGWVAAGLSLLVALTSVVWTLGFLSVVATHVELSVFVQNAATMLGLGVAVDYSLFLISRYREQRLQGDSGTAALTAALRTAGHTVFGSGLTVVLAMSTLFIIDLPVIRSLALGAVVVVSVALVANLVVLPALLAVFGDRLVRSRVAAHSAAAPEKSTRLREGRSDRGWHRWAHAVMRRPVASLLIGLAVLISLALPATQLSTFTPDARIVPAGASVRTGWDAIRADFGPGAASPINVVVVSDGPIVDQPEVERILAFSQRLDRLDHTERVVSADTILREAGVPNLTAAVSPEGRAQLPAPLASAIGHYVSADGETYVIQVIADAPASSTAARELLTQVRAEARGLTGVDVVVGGETAEGVDGNQAIADGLPYVAAIMLVVIYVLLLIIFRSVFLPLKAIVLNIASVAATYGVVVLVFQEGWGASLLGFEPTGHITNFVPVLLLTLLFSLSTDYEVFLLSRVREEYMAGAGNTESVARGLALTAPLISGAALLMVAVFSAFAFAAVLPVQELGLGMAFAIVLDATLVRLVLVPASMRLMGRWNWWHPFQAASSQPASPLVIVADRSRDS